MFGAGLAAAGTQLDGQYRGRRGLLCGGNHACTALKTLQSKTGPTASASSCIHPKNQLKGGGNGSSSYIVCKACHSRWAHSERSADVHKLLKHGPLSIKQGKTEASSPTRTSALAAAPVTPPRSEGRMLVDAMYGSPSTEGSMALVKEDLRVELNTHMQMILQQLKNEQAASTIQMSQFNAVQLQQMSDELRKATLANREQDLRQEKLIIQQQQASPAPSTPGKKDPRASSRRSPPPTTKKTCLCGKPAEALIVKKEGPRKGRMFWKCVQRKCDLFEWINEQDQADIEEAKTAASSLNPRRSKSPRREASASPETRRRAAVATMAVLGSAPSTDWTRVSYAERTPVVDVEDDEFDG